MKTANRLLRLLVVIELIQCFPSTTRTSNEIVFLLPLYCALPKPFNLLPLNLTLKTYLPLLKGAGRDSNHLYSKGLQWRQNQENHHVHLLLSPTEIKNGRDKCFTLCTYVRVCIYEWYLMYV